MFIRTLLLIASVALSRVAIAAWVPAADQASPTPQTAPASLEPLDKTQLLRPQRKVSTHLYRLTRELSARGATRQAVLASRPSVLSNRLQKVSDAGMVQCYVEYSGAADAVRAAIVKAGGKIELQAKGMSLFQAELPYDRMEAVAADAGVRRIRLPGYRITRTGSVLSQGDAVHRCNVVRASRGLTGAGIKVGVISDGINGIVDSQASGDIPPTYEAMSARSDGNLYDGAEGTAMMEIVHDLAPDASLAVSNPGTSVEMLSAIDILDSTFHCNVICDDLGFSDEPFFEDGDVVARIDQAVAGGAIYCSAAGNEGSQAYYEGDFVGISQKISRNNMTVQNFDGAGDWNMNLSIPANSSSVILLEWNDPWGASSNDYDLFVTNDTGKTIYAASEDYQDGTGDPWEAVQVTNTTANPLTRYIVVRKYSGVDRHLKIVLWGGTLTQYDTSVGSIYGHPSGLNVIACGAVRASTPATIEYFSSIGPVRIDFPSLVYRDKPDLCGVDGVSVTANGGFYNPFYGTSAATPHVAAVCAQVWSANPSLSNTYVRDLVQNSAVDLGATGFDTVFGFGRADAFNAVNVVEPVPGDFDHDGYVDDADMLAFMDCVSGPGIPQNGTPACIAADFDHDNDVDQSDFGVLQRCLSGTSPGDPACAN